MSMTVISGLKIGLQQFYSHTYCTYIHPYKSINQSSLREFIQDKKDNEKINQTKGNQKWQTNKTKNKTKPDQTKRKQTKQKPTSNKSKNQTNKKLISKGYL